MKCFPSSLGGDCRATPLLGVLFHGKGLNCLQGQAQHKEPRCCRSWGALMWQVWAEACMKRHSRCAAGQQPRLDAAPLINSSYDLKVHIELLRRS